MVCLKLAVLTSELESRFWNFVTQDYCDYYFFIYDWLPQKDKTQVLLAFEEEAIVGLMLIYDGSIVQLPVNLWLCGFCLVIWN